MNLIRYLKGAFLILSVGFMAGGACLLIHPDISAVTICMAFHSLRSGAAGGVFFQ